jgi:hypothetical protein
VTATGIGPESPAVLFLQRPPLQQHFTVIIENENTESPVQKPFLMGLYFFHPADGLIVLVDQ